MLEMDEGRIGFAEALRPPAGYKTEFVVGTTYTLDLRALLGLCIPLGLGFELDALDSVNPVSLFAALQELQGKIAIFCDKGHIKADIGGDARSRGLAILLEDMIHQVHVNRHHPSKWRRFDGLSSFHPKVWVVEYVPIEGDGEPSYRLLVMSRNLTFDTSWDAAISIDGHPGEPNECGAHLADFLEFLALGDSLTSTEKDSMNKAGSHSKRILGLAKSIRSVEFEVTDRNFDSVDFLPFGPQEDSDERRLLDSYADSLFSRGIWSLLVVSPFLSDAADSPLQIFRQNRSGNTGRLILISREDSLAQLDEDLRASYECYVPVPWLADVALEGDGEETPDAAGYSNLHAKIYFANGSDGKRHLYIGSLNASRNGMVNNVEAMLHLGVRQYRLTFDSFARSLLGDEKRTSAFAPYVPSKITSEADAEKVRFRRVFQASAKSIDIRRVTVLADGDAYRIDAEIDLLPVLGEAEGLAYTLRPLLFAQGESVAMGRKAGFASLSFGPMRLDQVTALFVFEGSDPNGLSDSCIIACPRDRFQDAQAPIEARSEALLDSILEAHDGALSLYIAHAFGVSEAEYGEGAERVASGSSMAGQVPIAPALYERLLEKAFSQPDTIRRAEYLLNLIPDNVEHRQVEELKELIDAFKKAVL